MLLLELCESFTGQCIAHHPVIAHARSLHAVAVFAFVKSMSNMHMILVTGCFACSVQMWLDYRPHMALTAIAGSLSTAAYIC